MESAMLAVGDHRIITHEFYALTGGEVTVGLMPCPTGISATLLYPDGSTTVQLSSESLGTLMRGGYILSAELQNAPTGKYTLQIDGTQCAESAVAKFLFREPGQDQVTLALDCTKSVPLTPTPLLTARVVKDGSTYTAAPLSLEVKISPRESAELSIQSLPMHDDGLDGDATAGDGIYTARVPDGSTPGKWEATLEATIPVGEAFVHRLGYLYFEVGDGTTAGSFTLPFTEEVIRKKDSSLIQKVCFGSQVTVGQPGEYQLNADLCDGNGKHFSCVSTRWVSEKAESRQVVLDLDPAELQESGVEGPWYLSDVELIYWPHSARTEYPQTIANSEIVQAISSVRTLYEMRTWLFRVSIGGSGVETLSDGRDAHAPKRLTIEIPATIEGEIPPEVRTGSFCMYSPTRQLLASLSANLVPSASGDGSWTIIATMEPNAFRYVNEDGPYTISNGMLQMRMPDNTVRFFEIQGSYETKPYSKELFHYVKPQNMEPQGRNLQIHLQTPGTPDGTGAHIYKATLRYTMPDPDEPIQDDGRGFAPGCAANPENKYFVWDKAGYIDFILQGNLDYIINDFSRSGYCLDVTEQVQEKLRQVGNRDGLFDPGETIEVEVELWNGGTELAEETAQKDLAFAIANRGLTLREANFTRVLHPFDRDKDWVISEAELAKGKEMWAESKVRPQLLLEGITLCGSTQYDYDKAAKKFVAGSRSLKP